MEHTVVINKEPVTIFDPMGKDATLFHFSVADEDFSRGGQYVEQASAWFNAVWDTISREYDVD